MEISQSLKYLNQCQGSYVCANQHQSLVTLCTCLTPLAHMVLAAPLLLTCPAVLPDPAPVAQLPSLLPGLAPVML
jgi:hypothetical protein